MDPGGSKGGGGGGGGDNGNAWLNGHGKGEGARGHRTFAMCAVAKFLFLWHFAPFITARFLLACVFREQAS